MFGPGGLKVMGQTKENNVVDSVLCIVLKTRSINVTLRSLHGVFPIVWPLTKQ